jgi:hypothetical protein
VLRWLLTACLLLVSVTVHTAVAAAERSLIAEAQCHSSGLEITIDNQTGFAVIVVLVRPFHTDYVWTPQEQTVADGEELVVPVEPPEDDGWGGTLVVTNLGVLFPPCGGIDAIPVEASRTLASERKAAASGLLTIAELASVRAYDGLWALMHPDAQVMTTFEAMACWYDGFLGPDGVGSAKVGNVELGPWTWGVTGQVYDGAATIEWEQASRSGGEARSWTDHLVESDEVWRWFLGEDPGWLAALPTSCDVSGKPVVETA